MRHLMLRAASAFSVAANRTPPERDIPEIDFERIAYFAKQPDQSAMLKAFRDELRETR